MALAFPTATLDEVRGALLAREEIALVDVREEAVFAQNHPLFAANLPLSRLELEVLARIPRPDTHIVVCGDGGNLDARGARRLRDLGYTEVRLFAGGAAGWREASGELFCDVNVPSKAFGELVEARRHTPSLSAPEVKALLDDGADMVVLDARRFDEYHTMSIPGGISVPGAELVLRARTLAPDPKTRIVVNCAGRTRSIIGTQSLVNAGVPNPVAALRNGTIGWTLAGQALEHGASRRFWDASEVSKARRVEAQVAARAVADAAGVSRVARAQFARWQAEPGRSTYLFDVRMPEEFEAAHLRGARSTPGGQLVQETDHFASVRGARLVLHDGGDNVRADMTASWLAQMGWEVHVLDGLRAEDFDAAGPWQAPLPPIAPAEEPLAVSPVQLAAWLEAGAGDTQVFDLASSAAYVRAHVPGARFVLRAELAGCLGGVMRARIVLTSEDGALPRHAAQELAHPAVFVLAGGTAAWAAAGLPVESGETQLDSPRIDRYRRPYEGTGNPAAAMQAYLDWEFGLVAQLDRDGTHRFSVI